MLGNVLAGAEPDAVMLARVIEEFDQAGGLCGPADETIVQGNAHHFRDIGALFVKQIEAVGQVGGEVVGGAEAVILVEAIVVGLERKRDDQVAAFAVTDRCCLKSRSFDWRYAVGWF
jgi:hypothetical protein